MSELRPEDVPVALLLFNRPDTTAQVFAAIRAIRPHRLFLIADGPRAGHAHDEERCAMARATVAQVDWPCEVHRDYAEANLGLKRRVESGLSWLFAQVESAIILEDDCVPDPSFFQFCAEMLARYREHEEVMGVAGTNFTLGRYGCVHSYYFSRYALIWGWATWRRAWQRYDARMAAWPQLREQEWLVSRLDSLAAARYWSAQFEQNYRSPHSWAYAWLLSCWLHDGLTVVPAQNLVRNVGFGKEATHTRDAESRFARLEAASLPFPLVHPPAICRDVEADLVTEEMAFSGEGLVRPMLAAARAYLRMQRSRM
jgi:hypothetical protein